MANPTNYDFSTQLMEICIDIGIKPSSSAMLQRKPQLDYYRKLPKQVNK